MKKARTRQATGFLSELIQDIDEQELAKARNRMMIAAKIADALHNNGMSQKDFAQLMGKSQTVITEWLSGNRNFTIDTLTDISMALHIRLLDTTSMEFVIVSNNFRTVDVEEMQTSNINSESECVVPASIWEKDIKTNLSIAS